MPPRTRVEEPDSAALVQIPNVVVELRVPDADHLEIHQVDESRKVLSQGPLAALSQGPELRRDLPVEIAPALQEIRNRGQVAGIGRFGQIRDRL